MLSIGQVLVIPTEEEGSNVYIVQKGDNLYKIALENNTTVNELIKLNNLTSQNLSIGQKLLIPIIEEEADVYIVQSGDTLYKLASVYNTSIDDLMKLNNLTSNILSIGQILKLPSKEDQQVYIVQSGDTLYGIAQKNNTTVNSIIEKNNLTSNILSIGQELII